MNPRLPAGMNPSPSGIMKVWIVPSQSEKKEV